MRTSKIIVSILSAFLLLSLFASVAAADEIDDRIAEINRAIEAHGANWVADRTWVFELPDELKHRLLSLKTPVPSPADEFFIPDLGDKQFPAHFDWRDVEGVSFVTPVRNQLYCGACWAFATVGALESLIAIKEGIANPTFDLSEQMLLSCTNAGNCTFGGMLNLAADALVNVGTIFEDCFPYQARDDIPCDARCDEWAEQIVTAKSWRWVGLLPPDIEVMKAAIMTAPVATGMVVFDDFMAYSGGIYEHVWGGLAGSHAVLLIGWDDAQQYWIAKNSWGTGWGEDGFFRIKWGSSLIGNSSILLDYEPGGFHPPADDDDTDDDVADDDVSDDDTDDSSKGSGDDGCGC